MMRKLIVMAMLVGLVGAGGFAKNASAGATIDLLFVKKNATTFAGTDTVTAVAGDVLTMQVRFTNDVGLTAIAISLNYDLDAVNELSVSTQKQWAGVALNTKNSAGFTPLGALAPSTATFVGSFNGALNNLTSTLTLPPGAGGYQIGTVVWTVNAGVQTDGQDIISGFLNPGVDGLGGAGFNDIAATALFHGATVNTTVIPEPGTAGLLGLGLVGLVLAGRRNRA